MRIGLFGGTLIRRTRRIAGVPAGDEADRSRSGVVAGHARQSTEGHQGLAPLAARVAAAQALAHDPRIDVTDLEAQLGTRYTYETVLIWSGVVPRVHFVWIMGADNLRSFHRWQRWRGIAKLVPIAVVDRLGPSLYATAGVPGQALAPCRLPETAARTLPEQASGVDLSAWPQIAAVVDRAAGGTGLARQLTEGN